MQTRRDAIAGLSTLGLSACRQDASRQTAADAPAVSIHRALRYDDGLYGLMRRIVAAHNVNVRGKRVVLKPNLVEFDQQTAINTHPFFVHAVAEAFRASGAASVVIAEGPGHRRITYDLAEAAGYREVFPKLHDSFVDLNLDEVREVKLSNPISRLESLYLPQTVLDCDLLVSLPKMKTHHWVGATLSMKNLFGLVPGSVYGWPKNILHWAGIEQSIVDINRLFPRRFAIVDGIVGMDGNGPIQGSPKNAGVVIAGSDPVAVDSTCCRVMGIDPQRIRYLVVSQTAGQTLPGGVKQIAETISSVQTPFTLIPQFQKIRLTA